MFFLSQPLKAEMKKNLASAQKELDKLAMPAPGEPPFMEALPPMIADALEMASVEIGQKHAEQEKAMAEMESARQNMEKIFLDTSSFTRMFRTPFKEEFSRSLETIKKDIANAKTEIDKTKWLKKNMDFDQEKVKKDLELAMKEVNRIGLDKTVMNALRIPAMLFGQQMPPMRMKRPAMRRNPEENQKLKTPSQPEAPQQDKEISVLPVNEDETSIELPGDIVLTPALIKELTSLASLAALQQLNPEAEKMFRMKLALIEKTFRKKARIFPALRREKIIEGDSIVIRVQ
jgi:hypothetical protein